MKKRFLPLLLSLTLALSLLPARAAGEDLFPAVNTYPGYADVKEGDWFYDNARLCYEIGLMNGTDHGFAPHEVLPVSQVLVIAARLRIAFTGESEPGQGENHTPWYAPYQTYWENIFKSKGEQPQYNGNYFLPELPATREFFLSLLALAIEGHEDDFPAINTVTALPDSDDPTVLFFYNMGLLTGVDEYGTFDGQHTVTRGQAAAMLARLVDPAQRLKLSFQSFSQCRDILGVDPAAVLLMVDGADFTAEDCSEALCQGLRKQYNHLLTNGNQDIPAALTYLEKTVKLYAAREALAVSLNLTVTDAEVDQRGPFRDGYQGQTTKSLRMEARQTILTEKLLAYFEAQYGKEVA